MPRNLKNRGFLGSWAVGSDTFCSIFSRTVQNRNSRPTWFLSHGSFDFSMPCEPPLGKMPPSCMEMCHKTDKTVSFHYRAVTNHSNPNEPTVFCVTHAALRLGELSGTILPHLQLCLSRCQNWCFSTSNWMALQPTGMANSAQTCCEGLLQ